MLLLSPFTRTSLSPILTISQAENSGRSLWLALAGPKSCGITVTKRREFERAGLSFKRVFEAVSFSGQAFCLCIRLDSIAGCQQLNVAGSPRAATESAVKLTS